MRRHVHKDTCDAVIITWFDGLGKGLITGDKSGQVFQIGQIFEASGGFFIGFQVRQVNTQPHIPQSAGT
jgi:hypothetical protein